MNKHKYKVNDIVIFCCPPIFDCKIKKGRITKCYNNKVKYQEFNYLISSDDYLEMAVYEVEILGLYSNLGKLLYDI